MTNLTTKDLSAIAKGYTMQCTLDGDYYSFEALMNPDHDLDATFTAWDMDAQEFVRPNGWMFSREVIMVHERDGAFEAMLDASLTDHLAALLEAELA